MGIYRGPNIVRDGLEFIIDPASERSYPGTGTVITDLSGYSNNLSMINGVVITNGVLIFNNTLNQYANTSSTILPEEECTVNIWFKPTNDSISSQRMFREVGANTNRYYMIYSSTGLRIVRGENTSNTATYSLPEDIWYNVNWYWKLSNLNQKVHINGELILNTTSNWTPVVNGGDAKLRLGSNSASEQNFIGHMSNTTSYFRELTSDEIIQNYNAHKTRFGL